MKKFIAMALVAVFSLPIFADEINVYSARKEALIKPALDSFTQATGIKVKLITGNADALISRMKSEGQFSPADVLITTDVGRLERAKLLGLTQAYDSELANSVVPAHLRDENNQWLALTLRARPIMYAADRVNPSELSTMMNLTDSKWKSRICIRSSNNIYNQSMTAAMLAIYPKSDVEEWARGMVANFARPPKGGDRDQIKAVAAGQCDLAIANTYYLAGMLDSQDAEQVKAAEKVKVFWPDQQASGTHINISGAAIAKHAKNVNNANALIEFMLTQKSQQWYAQVNHEYPVRDGVELSQTLTEMGQFKKQKVKLSDVGANNDEALKLMDKAGWR
ncbi:Fe(3+) ABC transporter substrate-binding protein [Glaciecola sp. KUL10]|uniref:Fe(3+) ABC transporter substrate-binding protein n=1 Tax=Glaciecola sp. (strain KUL10) TaxID=2161813 RepID=UPI000D7891DB|nr:Fe(3+) ABC transporter substrate-binding protein [Glaciecola sp. KUL10]GBL05809.1 extracellular solute-binding protein [Glaciecola sp. KUL10]